MCPLYIYHLQAKELRVSCVVQIILTGRTCKEDFCREIMGRSGGGQKHV